MKQQQQQQQKQQRKKNNKKANVGCCAYLFLLCVLSLGKESWSFETASSSLLVRSSDRRRLSSSSLDKQSRRRTPFVVFPARRTIPTTITMITTSRTRRIRVSSTSSISTSSTENTENNNNITNDEDDDNNEDEEDFHEPSPEKLTRLESEFNEMMDTFASYTPRDFRSVSNARTRALFEGVAAGANEPAVRRAFTVLFEDMVPVRVAGRMIYRRLVDVMTRSQLRRKREDESIRECTGLDTEDIDVGRRAFMAIIKQDVDEEDEEEGGLTIEQLVKSGVVETAVSLFGYDDNTHFIKHMESDDENGRVSFERFMYGLQRCANEKNSSSSSSSSTTTTPECDVSSILSNLTIKMKEYEDLKLQSSSSSSSSNNNDNNKNTQQQQQQQQQQTKTQKYNDRYENMLISFTEWEENFDLGNTRRDDVLRGCFAGAKNEHVVKALKIVYMDYAALRVAGDLIFKLMSRLIGSRNSRKRRRGGGGGDR